LEQEFMVKVVASFTMSLDGFIAGPNIGRDHAMGEGGERLHQWLFDDESDVDRKMAQEMSGLVGAVVLGKRTFDVGLQHWGDTPFPAPSFVVTRERRDPLQMKSAAFTFVDSGVESAVAQAKMAAGGKDVVVMGANVAQQLLTAGLVDEFVLQLAPVLLGQGSRLFEGIGKNQIELKCTRVVKSPLINHLRYEVI
jgi:dihydrofolate reductase